MSKKLTSLVLVTLLPANIYAQSCGTLRDGEVVRLDTENGSLRNSRSQDQDGLGTCYANTASVLLQSALPDSPDVSYLNLAIGFGEKVNGRNIKASAYDRNGDMLITGGTICETIRVAKENGGVCNRKDVPLESMMFESSVDRYLDNSHTQKEILLKVSQYYDGVNKTFSSQIKGNRDGGKQAKFISPEIQEKIQDGAKAFGDEAVKASQKFGSFLSDIGSKFKSFFNSLFDKGNDKPIDPPIVDPVIVDLNKNDGDKKPDLPEKDEQGLQDIIDQAMNKNDQNTEPEVANDSAATATEVPSPPKDPNLFSRDKFEALKKSKKSLNEKERYQLALYEILQRRVPDYSKKNCEKLDPSNALKVSKDLAALVHNLEKSGKYDPTQFGIRRKLYSSYSIINPGPAQTYDFHLSQDYKNLIEKNYLKSLTSLPAPKSGKDALVQSFKSFLNPGTTDKQVLDILNKLDPEMLSLLEDDYARYAKKDFSKCAKDKVAYFKNDDGFKQDFVSHPCLSQYQKLGDDIQNLVKGFAESNIADFEKLSDFILNSPDMNYEKALTQLLAPTCTDEQKIKIPKNLSCNDQHINFSSYDTNSPQSLARKMEQERAKLLTQAKDSLRNGHALGASLCTIFFKEDPNYFYNSSNSCRASRGDSFHAVSIIGYRCNAGKIDYLIQNSWGEWRDLDDNKYQREGSTGKAWIDEDSMIKNTYLISTLKN